MRFTAPWEGNELLVQSIPNERLNEIEKTLCALSLFVLRFSDAERDIWNTLRRVSKVERGIAQAIFSGVGSHKKSSRLRGGEVKVGWNPVARRT